MIEGSVESSGQWGWAMPLTAYRRAVAALFVGALALAALPVRARASVAPVHGDASIPERVDVIDLSTVTRKQLFGIAVRDVKLERAEPIEDAESSTLAFDVYNELDMAVSGVTISVSVLGPVREDAAERRAVIVRPFEVRLKEVLLPGYSVHYELRLRNMSAEWECVPQIEVLDARALADTPVDAPGAEDYRHPRER
jgi:hypothetical protein